MITFLKITIKNTSMDEIPKSKTQLELEKYERENNLNQPKSSRFENHFKDSNNDNNT